MLSIAKFPYTGPCFGPSASQPMTVNRATVKGLKRALIRLGILDQVLGNETDDYGHEAEQAMRTFQRRRNIPGQTGQYGKRTWLVLRDAKVEHGKYRGQYAMDALALKYVRDDDLAMCFPFRTGVKVTICQGPHITAGVTGNYAMDFCANGGNVVVAVQNATIVRLSGHDPAAGADQELGIFGWSITYETPMGWTYFSTHYGDRENLHVGQIVDTGQVIGKVGRWPGDPGRSHLHLGVTSPLGLAAAKKRILQVADAPRVSP